MADADSAAIRQHLQQLLSSEQMEKSEASQKLLRYLADRALRGETPKETEIAIDVFGRDASFNSAEESLVRVAVRALRRRLQDYYSGPGQQDAMRIDIPKGGYRLTFVPREPAPMADSPPPGSASDGGAQCPGFARSCDGARSQP
jgi:DNA-binding winged helix-turn-helix (wHTH) protein